MKRFALQRRRRFFTTCVIITLTPCFLITVRDIIWRTLSVSLQQGFEFEKVAAMNEETFAAVQNETGLVDYLRPHSSKRLRSFPSGNDTKVVLFWTPLFEGMNFLEIRPGFFQDYGCTETRCEVTSDRNKYFESDALVFHVRTMTMYDIPRHRIWRQKWIFLNLEAPPYSRFNGFAFMSGMFNWTMTYRNDSDIVATYGTISSRQKSEPPKENPYHNTINQSQLHSQWKMKSKMAVWMVSHCSTNGKREHFVREMEKYIDVDTFGECGIAACASNETNECLENFSEKYIFYLAFENSICDGYITEKFYRALQHNIIPVVFGGGRYSTIAPSESFINAFDFSSAKELSSHLHKVASHFSLYAKYFQWKLTGYNVQATIDPCNLCEKLHSKSFHEKSVYLDMDEWWVKRSNCRRWKASWL